MIKIDRDRLKIKWRDPKTLTPNPNNHRQHPDSQMTVLRKALEDEGWIDPVIFNKQTGRIVDGHARVEQAAKENVKSVPIIEIDVDELTERKVLARHDRIGALVDLDYSILEPFLIQLDQDGVDIDDLGWNMDEILTPDFDPTSSDDQPRLDEKAPLICPHCKRNVYEKT